MPASARTTLIKATPLLALVFLCGCQTFLKPTDQERHDSYSRFRGHLKADEYLTLRTAYFLFASDDESIPLYDAESGRVTYPRNSATSQLGQGLAVGIEPDGYLLTAGHVLRTNLHVLGWFDGRVELKPARRVYSRSATHADVAVIQVDARLDYCPGFARFVRTNDVVFAAVCYRSRGSSDIQMNFAAGRVVGIRDDPSGGPVKLVNTTVPIWRGDSGGPLLTTNGQLAGVTTGMSFVWRYFSWDYFRYAFMPDRAFIEQIIEADRHLRFGLLQSP